MIPRIGRGSLSRQPLSLRPRPGSKRAARRSRARGVAPPTLGGVALTIESQAGTDLTTQSAAFDAFLGGLGKSRSDFIVASAYAQRGLPAAVGAWRVRGVDPRGSARLHCRDQASSDDAV